MNDAIEGLQIPITSASKAQLRDFARNLGVTVTNFDDEQKIITKIQATGYDQSFIVVPDASAPKAVANGKLVAGQEVPEPMVEITIHTQEGAGGKRPIFVGVNGRGILIPRNQRVPIKHRYLGALEGAIETKYEFDEEAKANMPRDLPSYPYQVHKMPSDGEIQAYHDWYDANEKRLRQPNKAA